MPTETWEVFSEHYKSVVNILNFYLIFKNFAIYLLDFTVW